jgi:hypothetical protein
MPNDPPEDDKDSYWPLIWIGGVGLTVWLLSVIFIGTWANSWEKSGQFGDTFGAVNALFSGLALAGVVYAIFLQRKERRLQREEMKLQRHEPATTRKRANRHPRRANPDCCFLASSRSGSRSLAASVSLRLRVECQR